jgi:hypothetical protein
MSVRIHDGERLGLEAGGHRQANALGGRSLGGLQLELIDLCGGITEHCGQRARVGVPVKTLVPSGLRNLYAITSPSSPGTPS